MREYAKVTRGKNLLRDVLSAKNNRALYMYVDVVSARSTCFSGLLLQSSYSPPRICSATSFTSFVVSNLARMILLTIILTKFVPDFVEADADRASLCIRPMNRARSGPTGPRFAEL